MLQKGLARRHVAGLVAVGFFCPIDAVADEGVSPAESQRHPVAHAICVLRALGNGDVSGVIRLEQRGETVRLTGTIAGLSPGLHGFHVHALGDLTDAATGKSTGGHFAPLGKPHGRPGDERRHVGDLGNVTADERGVALVEITDTVISLTGHHSILGRSIVVHAGRDKFTQPTGDAGPRVAFGVIAVAAAPEQN